MAPCPAGDGDRGQGPELELPAQECHPPATIPGPHRAPLGLRGRVGSGLLPTPINTQWEMC